LRKREREKDDKIGMALNCQNICNIFDDLIFHFFLAKVFIFFSTFFLSFFEFLPCFLLQFSTPMVNSHIRKAPGIVFTKFLTRDQFWRETIWRENFWRETIWRDNNLRPIEISGYLFGLAIDS
jgi:hypothetical protein